MVVYISARKKLIHVMSLNTDRPINRAPVVGCAISGNAQPFEIKHAGNIKSPLLQHSCRNAEVAEAFCDAACRLSKRCRPTIHQPPVGVLRVPAEMPATLSLVTRHAGMPSARAGVALIIETGADTQFP